MTSPKQIWHDFIEYIARDGVNIAKGNGQFGDNIHSENAYAHAFTSAEITYKYGPEASRWWGNKKEELTHKTTNDFYIEEKYRDYLRDTYKDQYNNELGRRLGEYARENGLPFSKLADLVEDARITGDLLTDQNSPRVPDAEDLENGTASPFEDVTWDSPSTGWEGRSKVLPDGNGVIPGTEESAGMAAASIAAGLAGVAFPAFAPALGGYLGGLAAWWASPPVCPLVLDLDGNGLTFNPLTSSGAFFDLDADNFSEHTSWVTGADGILAIDTNGNGRIDNINEVFGGETTGGFSKLATYDTNHDGKITSADAKYGSLRIWKDANANGYTESGELKTLASWKITSINVNATAENTTIAGNHITAGSTFIMNGVTKSVKDVWFENEQAITVYNSLTPFHYSDAVKSLPNIHGYGTMPSLWIAATQDASLAQSVENLYSQNFASFNYAAFLQKVETVLLKWAHADTVSPTSRGAYVNAQHLVVLEGLMGKGFIDGNGTPDPNPLAVPGIENFWHQAVEQYAVRFLSFAPVHDFVAAMNQAMDKMEKTPNISTMSEAQISALLDPIVDPAAQALPNHPLSWLGNISYNTTTDVFEGDFNALIKDADKTNSAVISELVNKWFTQLPFIQAIAKSMTLTESDYTAAFTGTNLASILSLPLVVAVFEDYKTLGGDSLANSLVAESSVSYALSGGGGNDTITGSGIKDVILGGTGNDTVDGGGGADIFFVNPGDGIDTILGSTGSDTVSFGAGITWSNVQFSRSGASDIMIKLPGGGSVLDVQGAGVGDWGIETFKFADGTIKTLADVEGSIIAKSITSGNDTIVGFDDRNDTIASGAGADSISGWGGNDSLTGGTGNDYMDGGTGADIFVVNQGEGIDTVFGSTGNDTLRFSNTGTTWTTIQLSRSGDQDILIKLPDGGSVLDVQGAGVGDWGIETFKFADGTTKTLADVENKLNSQSTSGNDTINGFNDHADTISGGAGNDLINGFDGIDVITGGAGKDTLSGGLGNDVFDYNAITESTKAAPDSITDFDLYGDDKIDLRGLGFTGIVSGAATGTKLGYSFDAAANKTTVVAISDFKIVLDGHPVIDATDFIFS